MSQVTIEADGADLFYLANLVKRDVVRSIRRYHTHDQQDKRRVRATEGKGDVAAHMIRKHRRLYEQLEHQAQALKASGC